MNAEHEEHRHGNPGHGRESKDEIRQCLDDKADGHDPHHPNGTFDSDRDDRPNDASRSARAGQQTEAKFAEAKPEAFDGGQYKQCDQGAEGEVEREGGDCRRGHWPVRTEPLGVLTNFPLGAPLRVRCAVARCVAR